jgi:UDP-N-acetylmuramoyl-tripeptide--D-alanyl-D-alanine ligase
MAAINVALIVISLIAGCIRGPSWLRVAQREHYLGGMTTRFAQRWWLSTVSNVVLLIAAIILCAMSFVFAPLGAITAAIVATGPLGLSKRGKTSPLVWTRRLKTVAAVTVLLFASAVVTSALLLGTASVTSLAILLLPLFVDASLFMTKPLEDAICRKYIGMASRRLHQVVPVVVAVTGSYGKTTTKEYIRELVTGYRSVVASPASYNNVAGLCRTINEHLAPGTEVLVAEVGTYGPGEIRQICEWLKPSVALITAIGPVHLERMGSISTIVRAKSEILEGADIAILNVDSPELRVLASAYENIKVMRCGQDDEADVVVSVVDEGIRISAGGQVVGTLVGGHHHPGNVACAVAAALAVNVPKEHIAKQLGRLSVPAHRRQLVTLANGLQVIDDTYNSNPAGARAALELLASTPANRRVVVTPGMIELGERQPHENESFALHASDIADDLLIVGRTNKAALVRGARAGHASYRLVSDRGEAVAWVRDNLKKGDVVLYENDLPDHFP